MAGRRVFPLCVTVNLSARQFRHPRLPELIARILHETGLSSRWLELEITETIVMEDVEVTIPLLTRLVDMGIRFSIDDFGTGYSSLSYLKKFPVHKLKIDKSFIRGLPDDPDDGSIVTAVIALAHNMNLDVVAEGWRPKNSSLFCVPGSAIRYRGSSSASRFRLRSSGSCFYRKAETCLF
ncbi:MAG: EAL domain-containing protein [Thermodesulfovibrionales bacterium]